PTATIIGGPDLHVDKGSTINLTCAVKYSPEPPAYIFWYHHDEVISYDSSRGGVSVITEKGDVTTSHLLIQNADLDDSGKYSCSPSNADVASVRVHVLNGEHPEAMQTGAASQLGKRQGFPFLLVISFGTILTSWLLLIRWQMNGIRLAISPCWSRRFTSDEWKSPNSHLSRQFDGTPVRQRKKQSSTQPSPPLMAASAELNVESTYPPSRQWSGR
ncbi:uncharacterized protein LOC131695233, partial [Topomyia yanbarensis]|uniref:uncharacterized protein LOC131695233 n=1 Tax=Topomyia yanbarensis TaxID=2498891 RepID=UPI00273BA696